MASSSKSLNFSVSHRGTTHRLSLPSDTPLSSLEEQLQELTGVPPHLQKLIFKGKKANHEEDAAISDLGIKDGAKIQMLGTTTQELEGMKTVENEQQRRERIMRDRAMKPQYKARSTGPSTGIVSTLSTPSSSSSPYKFQEIVPLPHLPNPEMAKATLERLAADPAIRHVMQKHQFSVGVLTELAPHEQPHLLGLNVNAGQAIKLRVYTDRYDGFRNYKEIRRVLCHELAHNVWGDHDNNFKELNSQLNREVAEYERAVTEGAHSLSGQSLSSAVYSPGSSSELEAEAQAYVLGGSGAPVSGLQSESAEDRRRRVLEATMNRLRKEEEEIEHSCVYI
ncbi:hypothetical protein MD484_g4489, partial [Candolleomyces efflorescens]